MKKITKRAVLLGAGAAVGGWLTQRYSASNPTLDGTQSLQPTMRDGTLNDASGLSETPIFKHITLSDDPGEALLTAIRSELSEARANGRPLIPGAARHSMGGQALPREGHAISFDNAFIQVDQSENIMRLHAGARWSDVIATLDPLGLGPKVMQSNNDFGVGATFCVNAHGWPVKQGPMGSTVRNFDMVLPGGELVTCSRDENADLFHMTMGGYGLTGVIMNMEVDLLPNQRLAPTFTEMPAEEFGMRFIDTLADDTITMAYGRLNVDRANFLTDALMITYQPTGDQSDLPAAAGSGVVSKIASRVYRRQLGNERIKRLRWWFETDLAATLAAGETTRNSLINEPVVTLDERDPGRTDILHEYFVAPDRFTDFLTICRNVIPASYQEFLNVTLRYVDTDPDSWLSYAPVPRIAAVMSFSQEMTVRAEADMARMTHALINGITGIGGTYYLPYRAHASVAQFSRAYPRAKAFADAKRRLDPDLVLRNNLWDRYLGAL